MRLRFGSLIMFGLLVGFFQVVADQFGDFSYEETEDGIIITQFRTHNEGGVAVPQEIDGKPVVAIGPQAFAGTQVTDILLREGILRIESEAFSYASVERINIPSSVVFIDASAFLTCRRLESMDIASGNEHYSFIDGVLYDKAITEIVTFPHARGYLDTYEIPNGIRELDMSFFTQLSGLFTISIPESLTCIFGMESEYYLDVGEFLVDENNPEFSSVDGVLFSKDKRGLIRWPPLKGYQSFEFPESTTVIGEHAFSGCYFEEQISLPESLNYIAPHAFRWSRNLRTISIPSGIAVLEEETFSGCRDLVEIHFNRGLLSIEKQAFSYCTNLRQVVLPDGFSHIRERAFESCFNLFSVTVPQSLEHVGDYAFEECEIEWVFIPENLTSIGSNPFLGCPIRLLSVHPDNTDYTNVGNALYTTDFSELILYFNYQSSPPLELVEGLKIIRENALHGARFDSISLPESLEVIEKRAFFASWGYEEVRIPSNVATIEEEAFYGNSDLKAVVINAQSVSVEDSAFYECQQLETVRVNGSITSLGAYSFYDCENLSFFNFPEGLTEIGEHAFSLAKLENLTIPNTVKELGDFAFEGCYLLQDLIIGEGVTSIGEGCFVACGNIRQLTIPASVKVIQKDAFRDCSRLTRIVFQEGIEEIGSDAFYSCGSLKQLTIPSTLSRLSETAFHYTSKLSRLYFLGDAPEILVDAGEGPYSDFDVYFFEGASGVTTPEWEGYDSFQIKARSEVVDWLLFYNLPHETVLESVSLVTGSTILNHYALDIPPWSPINSRGLDLKNELLSLSFFGNRAGIQYVVETSKDLNAWTANGVSVSEPDHDGMRTASFNLQDGRCFVRFRFVQDS